MGGKSMSDAREIIERFAQALSGSGAGADPWEFLDDDVVIHVAGTTPLSGQFSGRRLIEGILVHTARERLQQIRVDVSETVAQGERIAAVLVITGQTVDGGSVNDKRHPCACVFEVREGRIVAMDFLPDTMLIERDIYNRHFVANQR